MAGVASSRRQVSLPLSLSLSGRCRLAAAAFPSRPPPSSPLRNHCPLCSSARPFGRAAPHSAALAAALPQSIPQLPHLRNWSVELLRYPSIRQTISGDGRTDWRRCCCMSLKFKRVHEVNWAGRTIGRIGGARRLNRGFGGLLRRRHQLRDELIKVPRRCVSLLVSIRMALLSLLVQGR